jgi:hypothetical protein
MMRRPISGHIRAESTWSVIVGGERTVEKSAVAMVFSRAATRRSPFAGDDGS